MAKFILDAIYIVFDGTSYYGVYGCDVEDEIKDNEVEIAKGPFLNYDDNVDKVIEQLNDDVAGRRFDKRYQKYY